ncbi:MAG: GEVED domain-containing protein, partial [Verrucomicrobiota bacterium]
MKANPHCAAHLQASGVSGNWSWRTARHALALFLLPLLSAIHVPGQQLSLDFGDAPRPYPTLLSEDGARHATSRGFHLGSNVDLEPDGQPEQFARGDDQNPAGAAPDEDGVIFNTPLEPGAVAEVDVIAASGGGRLDAWMDFNGDGDWADANEQIFRSVLLGAGSNLLRFTIPSDALNGPAFVRFRLSAQGGLKPTGFASEGEVEDYAVFIGKQSEPLDFGDAPQGYPTVLSDNGARHNLVQGFSLGKLADPEPDGQPDSFALGDDTKPSPDIDDEDGVVFLTSPMVAGQPVDVEVTCELGDGHLDAWIDFNQDRDWNDPGEQIFAQLLQPGANRLRFNVTANAAPGETFARFRLSFEGKLQPTGPAQSGEVEDYLVKIEGAKVELDFGDAPESYPTRLAQDGARHVINPDFFLGRLIDPEADGQPSAGADGDDLNPSATADDEDGVRFISPLLLGKPADVEVTFVGGQGRLDAWIDFNANGNWNDPGEQIFANQPLVSGPNNLTFAVPPNAVARESYARFRLSLQGGLKPNGPASEGEVEDYVVKIEKPAELDFGDAPQSYPTLLAQDGARHVINPDFFLGRLIDPEADGQPSAGADGDDLNPSATADDEDGVRFISPLLLGKPADVEVTFVGGQGRLDAWIDFNGNGNWNDPGEQIFANQPLVSGPNHLTFVVPPNAVARESYARFRLSLQGGLKPNGPASEGEVEDYVVKIEKPAELDFGDAPQSYPTLLAQDGARHVINPDFFLGRLIDPEADGQPSAGADGDDLNPSATAGDDEDGVRFITSPLLA